MYYAVNKLLLNTYLCILRGANLNPLLQQEMTLHTHFGGLSKFGTLVEL